MMVSLKTHMVDLDVRKKFYNFQLLLVLAKYYGVDLVSYLGNIKDSQLKPLWLQWVCLVTDLVLSPYASIQGLL